MKKKLKIVDAKLLLAIILSLGALYFLYDVAIPKDKINIRFVQYVKAKDKIRPDTQITDEMLVYDTLPADKIPAEAIRTKNQIINKFTKTEILPGEMIRKEKVKEEAKSEFTGNEREIRILTNVQAYCGVGPGDRADLLYVGGANSDIGAIKYEGVLVKKVLTSSGKDIEQNSSKYNEGDNKPYMVIITGSQDMALRIETLQSKDNEVHFKFIKWTEKSKKQGTENTVINGSSALGNK